jgi:hypothetical protein
MSMSRKKDGLKPERFTKKDGVSDHPAHRWAHSQRPMMGGGSVQTGIKSESPGLPDGSVDNDATSGDSGGGAGGSM